MSIIDLIDRDKLVCTFCGKIPVVGVTFAVDAEVEDGVATPGEVDPSSIIAVCKAHLPILQEQFEKEVANSEVVAEITETDDGN